MDLMFQPPEIHRTGKTAFGLEGLDPLIAEMLFIDYRINPTDAVRLKNKLHSCCDSEVRELSALIYDSFNASLNEFQHLKENDSELLIQIKERIFEKLDLWSKDVVALQLEELLKLNEYFNLPITDLPGIVIDGPESIYKILGNYIVDQDEYIKQLSLAYYIHHLKNNAYDAGYVGLPTNTIIVSGPTGVGKSEAPRMLSKLFNVPTATSNCNTVVSEGIVGPTITDPFTELYIKYRDISKVEQAIVHYDEFDKLFQDNSGVYNSRIINELLNIIDNKGVVSFKSSFGRDNEYIHVSTQKMLFIFSGVFEKLPDVIQKRINPDNRSIGFVKEKSTLTKNDYYRYAIHQDYQKAGVKPEIMGRINSVTYVNELNRASIAKILLNNSTSPLLPFKRYFLAHNIHLELTPEGAYAIAGKVIQSGLGARGIKNIINSLLNQEMYNIRGFKESIIINADFVNTKIK